MQNAIRKKKKKVDQKRKTFKFETLLSLEQMTKQNANIEGNVKKLGILQYKKKKHSK